MFFQCEVHHIECLTIYDTIGHPLCSSCSFVLSFAAECVFGFGLRTVTSLAVVIIFSIPRHQLAHS